MTPQRRTLRMVRRVGYAMTVAALLGLSACSGSSGSGASASGKTTLTVWEWGSPGTTIKKLTDAFNTSHPNIKVQLVVQPFNSYFTQLHAAIAAKSGPNVVQIYASPFIFDYYHAFLPLNSYATPAQKKELLGWNLVSSGLSNNGQAYAMPWTGQGELFYYNKALFKKAGLNPNQPPTTFASLLTDCTALKAHGIVPIVAGFKDGYYAEWWGDLFSGQYMTAAQAASTNPSWTSPAMVKALTYMKELYQKGCMTPDAASVNLFPDTVNNFADGKGAIFVGLAANNANWTAFQSTLHNNLGDFLAPTLPGSIHPQGSWFDYAPGLAWSITRWTPDPKAAYEYLSYMAEQQNQTKAFSYDGTLPNTPASTPTSSYDPAQRIIGWIKSTSDFPGQLTLVRSNVEATFDKVVPEIVTGQLSVSAAMAQVEATQQQSAPIPPA
jgi:multiple sugar transport system substrate-binding protein